MSEEIVRSFIGALWIGNAAKTTRESMPGSEQIRARVCLEKTDHA